VLSDQPPSERTVALLDKLQTLSGLNIMGDRPIIRSLLQSIAPTVFDSLFTYHFCVRPDRWPDPDRTAKSTTDEFLRVPDTSQSTVICCHQSPPGPLNQDWLNLEGRYSSTQSGTMYCPAVPRTFFSGTTCSRKSDLFNGTVHCNSCGI
jgi:hypothetical protein